MSPDRDISRTESTGADLGSLSGSFALNALDAADAEAFEQHLASSPETRNEVTELTDTAVLLGLAVEPVTPSASLKASIMDQLDSHPQIQDAPVVSAIPAFTTPAQSRAERRWFTRPVVALAAVAAAVGLIAGGGVIATNLGDNSFQQSQADQLAAINGADDAQRSSVSVGEGTATLVWSNSLLRSALIVDGMEPAPAGKVYELWYINDDGARPAGTFTVADDGRTWRVLDGDMHTGDLIGVTIEPEGGSETPTSDPIMKIESA